MDVFYPKWVLYLFRWIHALHLTVVYKSYPAVIVWVELIMYLKVNRLELTVKGLLLHFLIQIMYLSVFLRLQEALKIFPHVYVEMTPGDALFFHCNLLHSSDQNNSDQRRWVMITSYNKKKNNPVLQHHHPFYHPLHMVANKAILECKTMSSVDKAFLDPNRDYSHQN